MAGHSHRPGALAALRSRGFVKQCTDEVALAQRLDEGPLSAYVGVDATAASLHVGHLVPIYAIAHLAHYGHNPIVVIGGGTAKIGDPSGKSEMRKMLAKEQIGDNAKLIAGQIRRFLAAGGIEPVMVNNAEWLDGLGYIDFLRDIGRHFSVNRMLTFETYKMRLETGLSFIEFNYQLLQSYDFLHLSQAHGCALQVGGDDQWGNIVAGVDLIRRVEGPDTEAFGLTFPLLTRSDGKKMGKTEAGAVFLDPELLSPYDFFQYWRNVPDVDVAQLLRTFTFLPVSEIDELTAATDAATINAAKERLAVEVTTLIHGASAATDALTAAKTLFAGGSDSTAVPSGPISAVRIAEGVLALDLFVESGLCASKGEARRLIQQGGARIDGNAVESIETVVHREPSVTSIALQAGKKRHFRFNIIVE